MTRKYHEGDEPVPGSGYRLTEFLGRGGFGEVWKASAPGGTEAALKIIQLGGTEGRKEFRALQLVKKIRHTHLVPIFSFWMKNAEGQIIDDALIGTAETCAVETKPGELRATMAPPPLLARPQATELIIAMGLGDKSLYDRLQERLAEGCEGIPQDELLHYLEDAAEAIDFLNRPVHNLGSGPAAIQHCDIKPHNLMIVGGGAQVCDFGLARMMGADRTTTAAATLAYAAPECLVEGKPSDSTDQYSLAVSYYELKTGVLPYHDETLAAVMDAKRQGKLDFCKVPPAIQGVLRRATSQNPADRFPSALEMVKALQRAAATLADTEPACPPRKARERSKIPLLLLGLLILIGGGVGAYVLTTHGNSSKSQKAVQNIERPANKLLAANKQVSPVAQKTPVDPALAFIKEARAQILSGQWQSALKNCDGALQKNPNSAEAFFLRGRCRLNLEPIDYDKAIADLEKVKSLSDDQRFRSPSDLAVAYLGRGTAMLNRKSYDEAIADLTTAGEYNPGDYRIFSRLGVAWLSKGNWQQAVNTLNASLKINSKDDTDFVNRGRAYQKLGEFDNAVADFRQAATINPQNAAVHLQLGNAYLDLKEPLQAIAAFGKAIDESAKKPDEKEMLAQAYLARGSVYIDREPTNLEEKKENCRKALADFTRAIGLLGLEDAALLASAHKLRASCFDTLDQIDNAKIDTEIVAACEMLKKYPDDAHAMNNMAYHLATSADPSIRDNRRAILFATEACRLSEWKNHDFLDTLATVYAEAGQFDKAIEWETKALEIAPDKTDEDKKNRNEFRTRLEHYQKGEK